MTFLVILQNIINELFKVPDVSNCICGRKKKGFLL